MRANKVNELDLLRFLAAFAVVFFHYAFRGYAADGLSVMPYPLLAPFAKYGYLGVDLFFMISGFVILLTTSGGSLRAFFVSRVVRLYPAFWACCSITVVFIVVLGGARFHTSLSQYLINLTMFSEFVAVPSIDGSYWSLFVEMRFYALVAAVLMVGRIHQALPLMMCWLIASILLEIVPSYTIGYYLVADYAAYFIAGAICFLIWSNGISLYKVGMLIACWGLAIFQSLHRATAAEHSFHTSLDPYVVSAIITAFFVILVLVALRRTGALRRSRWALVGALTYPLYLLHQNIGFMIFNATYPKVNPHALLWGTVLLVVGMAFAVHTLIEKRYSSKLRTGLNRFIDFAQRKAIASSESDQLPGHLEPEDTISK